MIAHEPIHVYQYREHQVFNTWLRPLSDKVTNKTIRKIVSKYVYADIPFFNAFYLMQYDRMQNHFKNFYEFEAERFASNRDIWR